MLFFKFFAKIISFSVEHKHSNGGRTVKAVKGKVVRNKPVRLVI